MTLSLKLLLRLRKRRLITAIAIFSIEILLFISVCYVHRKLDAFRMQLDLSAAKQKELIAATAKQSKISSACFENSKLALASLKKICAQNNIDCKTVSVIERTDDINFRLSGTCDFNVFVTFMTDLRKSRYLIKLNSFEIVFAGNKLNYTLNVQSLRSLKEK